jgi:hypothetical protein
MKVAELSGALLDYWVAKAGHPMLEGLTIKSRGDHYVGLCAENDVCCIICDKGRLHRIELCGKYGIGPHDEFSPSSNWAHGGPIIEREGIEFGRQADNMWGAWIEDLAFDEPMNPTATGPIHLIAAMRAYVASKFGDTVPDEVPV